MKKRRAETLRKAIAKSPTGIRGLDEITGGGLPTGRPTLVCGGPGCGKTLLAMEFIVRGAMQYGEPGVFMAFEENAKELTENVASLGFDLRRLIAQKKLLVDYVRVERSEIEETGQYDLEGLFIRLDDAIKRIGARRVALDTIEGLFAGLPNAAIVRSELRRLFRWLKDKGVTVIITGERGDGMLTRYGLEEYISDCVIFLDHRVVDQMGTRRLRVVKYRGSLHGTNEYPFLIDQNGLSVLPVTSLRLDHDVSNARVTSGIPRLDFMLGGKGYYRGSSILISGTAGTGKSSVAATFANAVCARGERCLYFAFEESPAQILRNMRSIGLDLQRRINQGRLQFHAERPTYYGLEMHLATAVKTIIDFSPQAVVLDPISNLSAGDNPCELKVALIRLMDFLKAKRITTLLTSLTAGGTPLEHTNAAISSLVDTWLVLRDLEINGERNRVLHLLKSRGMAHSNQVREFRLTSQGVQLSDVYVGPGGVLTGSARLAQETRDKAEHMAQQQELEQQRLVLEHKRHSINSQIAALEADFAAEAAQFKHRFVQNRKQQFVEARDRQAMSLSRQADLRKAPLSPGPEQHDGEAS